MPPVQVTDDIAYDPDTGRYTLLAAPGEETHIAPPTEPGQDPVGAAREIGGTVIDALSLIPGLAIPRLGLRTATMGLSGAVSGAVHPEQTAAGRGASEAALEGGFGKLAEKLPRGGLKLGLIMGGVRGPLKRHREEIVDAFMRIRDRYNPVKVATEEGVSGLRRRTPEGRVGALPIGAEARTEKAKRAVGKQIQEVEESTPGQVFAPGVFGGTADLQRKATNSEAPFTTKRGMKDAETRIVDELLADRESPWLNYRDAMEIARDLRQQGKAVFEARAKGDYLPPDAMTGAQTRLALADRFEELAEASAKGDGDAQLTALAKLRAEFADLSKIDSANRAIRGGVGAAGVRGGAGYGVGSNIEFLTGGLSGGTAPNIAGLFGLVGLEPGNISRLGFSLGSASRLAPTASRVSNLQAHEEARDKRPVRRRQPKD